MVTWRFRHLGLLSDITRWSQHLLTWPTWAIIVSPFRRLRRGCTEHSPEDDHEGKAEGNDTHEGHSHVAQAESTEDERESNDRVVHDVSQPPHRTST